VTDEPIYYSFNVTGTNVSRHQTPCKFSVSLHHYCTSAIQRVSRQVTFQVQSNVQLTFSRCGHFYTSLKKMASIP